MMQMPNLYQRIIMIMSELDYVAKGDKTVNGQYRFVSHDQVTAKVHPLLVKYRVVILPTVEELRQENNRTVVKLSIVFRNADYPEDAFFLTHYGYGIDASDKGIGKAISYAYKYALLKTFCLETGDDPDYDTKLAYEPEKCLEFESETNGLPKDEKKQMRAFLKEISESSHKHVEDVKREAMKRMPDFLNAFNNWMKQRREAA